MRQFAAEDLDAANAKENLWEQDSSGNWRIDPEKDALRMANHTRVYHTRPSIEVVHDAIKTMIQGSPELSSVCTVYRNEIRRVSSE